MEVVATHQPMDKEVVATHRPMGIADAISFHRVAAISCRSLFPSKGESRGHPPIEGGSEKVVATHRPMQIAEAISLHRVAAILCRCLFPSEIHKHDSG